MTNTQVGRADPAAQAMPTAVGLVRADLSGTDAPRHAVEVSRHARALGYRYVYTIRPPMDESDPVGYALGIAAMLGVAAVVVYRLIHVQDRLPVICDRFDLEIVSPAETWVRSGTPELGGEAQAG